IRWSRDDEIPAHYLNDTPHTRRIPHGRASTMSSTAAPQPMTITAGACAPGVPAQPTALSNISFAAVNSPPPAETTVSNANALSTFTTTSALIFTQTAAVNPAQLLLIAQA